MAPLAGVLSYLVPGLGQIVQGRVGKGLLFLVCVYALFFYGMYLGTASVTIGDQTYRLNGSVYVPQLERVAQDNNLPPFVQTLYKNRPQFVGQFWVGIVVWPAILQYRDVQQAVNEDPMRSFEKVLDEGEHPYLGRYQREPSASALSAVHNAGDKRLELGWVYTVIAGVLNILVISDAVAGPVFAAAPEHGGRLLPSWLESLFGGAS